MGREDVNERIGREVWNRYERGEREREEKKKKI
jgi:hypothetical protein